MQKTGAATIKEVYAEYNRLYTDHQIVTGKDGLTFTGTEPSKEEFDIRLDHVLRHLSEKFLRDMVIFKTQGWMHSNKMIAKEFKLPFRLMSFEFSKPIPVWEGLETSSFEVCDMDNEGYSLMIPNMPYACGFRILESGEIDVFGLPYDREKNEGFITYSTDTLKNEVTKMPQLFSFAYEVCSLIDYINNKEYVVTENTVKHRDSDGNTIKNIQRRLKIKREKGGHTEATGKGTKHRYKYRVRGHFRTLENGKEVWVHDHVRGGDGTIFIAKEYEII